MGKNNWFQFKQFKIIQEHSAMKVGVDGVLLGAWADVRPCKTILDVGTGTGVIALMMAQRSDARITAIDQDEPACREALFNVRSSPWNDRVEIRQISFQEFAASCNRRFDGIVSNPPFFEADTHPSDFRRKTARHNGELPFPDLMGGVKQLLNLGGKFSVILPAGNVDKLIRSGRCCALFPNRMTWVKPNPAKRIHRCLVEFSETESLPVEEELLIEGVEHGSYTDAYKKLTRDFYLAF